MSSFYEKPSFCHEGTALPLADYDSRFVREGGAPEGLNPEQEAAATAVNGRVCINSGAGSGKSTVLIARMVAIQQVFPEARVLLISFTKKSAQELKERIGAMPNVSVSTFHSLCYHLLMRNGYKHFQVSTNDMLQETIIRKLIGKADSTLEEVKASLVNAGAATKETLVVRDKYLNYLLSNRMLTFDTLQVFALELLTKTGIRNRWANQWDFIEIDESQDMDCNQVQLANILATGTGNICYCGDSRQAIYGFRGSLPTVITDFAKSAENHDLTLNYRCNAGILGLGNNIMSKHKPLIAARLDEPVYPKYSACADEADEAKTICDEIALLHKGGMAYSDISILYRRSYASSRIFEELLTRKIPFVAKSFTSFTFSQYPYASAVAMFRAALMPDSREIIKAILPSLYLKADSMKQVTAIKNKEKCTYLDALTKLQLPFFQQEYIASMVQTVSRIPSMAPTKAIEALLKAGLGKYVGEQNTLALQAFSEELTEYTTIPAYLHHIGELQQLLAQMKELTKDSDDYVDLQSIHASKGLEYKCVFICGCYDGCIPSNKDDADADEERRILYVGVTRAKDLLYISYPKRSSTTKENEINQLSRFLIEAFND